MMRFSRYLDSLLTTVRKTKLQRVRSDNLKALDTMNGVTHGLRSAYLNGAILTGG
jgi:hypothetical protein